MKHIIFFLILIWLATISIGWSQTPAATQIVTNDWAVHLAPGADPDQLARDLGGENRGPIAYLTDYYHFHIPQSTRDEKQHEIAANLRQTTQVRWFEQQVARVRTLCAAPPTDPLFSDQWHLVNTGQSGGAVGIDINVLPLWADDILGTGVVVGVIDTGVEYDHPEIAPNYRADLSYDYFDNDADPYPGASEPHGTAVAAPIVARDDGSMCGVGVAYRADVASIRLTVGATTDLMEANALSHQRDNIAVYNNSWAPGESTPGEDLGPIGALAEAALADNVTNGRGGLGNIYVFSAGNGRIEGDNVNYDGFNNSRYTISVGAVDHNGQETTYGEPGAPILISAPSRNNNLFNSSTVGIYTSDRIGSNGYVSGNCLDQSGGTSTSAAEVTGVIALVLEVNPNLTWRDVQHILVETAIQIDVVHPGWATNGAGKPVNHLYGFGIIDAEAAVDTGQLWTSVAAATSVTSGTLSAGVGIPDNNATGVTDNFNLATDLRIEHVEVVFSATHTRRADLEIELTSPDGTVSTLAEYHANDNNADYSSWRFMTVHNWGETSAGNWSLKVADTNAGNTGTFDSWELIVHGTPITAPDTVRAIAGTPQATGIDSLFDVELTVTVVDAGGDPVVGETVTFSAPGSGASGVFPSGNTAVTNAGGVAAAPFQANSVAGSYVVTANVTPPVATGATFNLTNNPAPIDTIFASAGTPQSAVINTAFSTDLQVTLTDSVGNPISGETVTFTAPGSGASGIFTAGNTDVTDANGLASVPFTANATAGSFNVTANISPALSPAASFALTNNVGAADSIYTSAGDAQSTMINTAFSTDLEVTLVDEGGNPVSGETVTFTAPGSGASGIFTSGNTAVTDGSGLASVPFSANSTAGNYQVTANISPALPTAATFNLANLTAAADTIFASMGTPQSTTINTAFSTQLEVTVWDVGDNPVSGAIVTFTAPGSGAGGTFPSGNSATTNASGTASVPFIANATAGTYTVTANCSPPHATPASFSLTNLVGAADSIFASAGTPQNAMINTAFATDLEVTLVDEGGNPISGETVTFSAPGSGASGTFTSGNTAVTDVNGRASAPFMANMTVGAYAVTANIAPALTPAATFALSNTAGTPDSIFASAGTPQSVVILTAFSDLEVTVIDAGGNPVSGETVTFTAPGSGASGTFPSGSTAMTDINGMASAPFTANSIVGSYIVTANVSPALSPVASFNLTNLVGSPANISASAGTPQNTVVNTAFSIDLEVTLTDAGGNPVSGETVTFTAPGSGASGTFPSGATAVTDGSGIASVAFTANATAGSYTVSANISPPLASAAMFNLTNTAAVPAGVNVVSGSGQSAPLLSPFGLPLEVRVVDAGNNPIAGVVVTFTSPSSGPSATFATRATANVVTNASGIATQNVTANGMAGSYVITANVTPALAPPAAFNLTNAGVASVPTVGEWGLINLALLVFCIGMVAIQQLTPVWQPNVRGQSLRLILFDRRLFGICLSICFSLLFVGFVVLTIVVEPIAIRDVFGASVSCGFISYLIHVYLLGRGN